MAKSKQPAPPLALTSFRQLKALAHPLRFRAFERLIDVAKTGKQLATELGKQPTHLYHHLRVLERAGLVRQVARRKKRGTTEKYFRAVSDRVVIDEGVFRRKVAGEQALVGQVLQVTLDELAQARATAGDGPQRLPTLVKRLRIRTTPKQIEDLQRRLDRWLAAFEGASSDEGDAECAVTVAFYAKRIAGE